MKGLDRKSPKSVWGVLATACGAVSMLTATLGIPASALAATLNYRDEAGRSLNNDGNILTTIVNNGPSSNRVDVVFLGDGYTSADLAAGIYDNQINNYLNYKFSNSLNSDPFFRYRNYFNIHKINVVSNESGADVPPLGIFRDTALDGTYYFDGVTERLLYVNTSKSDSVRDLALTGAEFTAEMQYVTINDTKYGGGGGDYAVYAGSNASSLEVALHEVAHSFSNLADEYGGFTNPYTGAEPSEVNVTNDATGDKWSRWNGYNQPGIGVIGAYDGGRYYDRGIYRPSNNSKMRSLNQPFDVVGREKIILDIYDLVNPLDSWLDNSTPLINPDQLFVNVIDDSVINLEWFVDGTLIPLVSGETFNLSDFGYGAGDYVVSTRAFDPTGFDPVDGWVRTNQSNLEQFVSWNVTITSVPEPSTTLASISLGLIWLASSRRKLC
ncbi:M64 family metallopeptidase [Nostoc sp. ChiQUE01b]|uniref:M64 family metallopeptidase n=1 Tax=Nostoc sp. ChiQUE01b TaxID=3075376 RepID=UPI002AD5B087|nr:M64 family metallopeptidase [Nostoc sp. ChiQUE01b]MDZ8258734.1 M64 family metallopeptidase [Nostoc sp. ChiQUE01b]